MQHVDDGILHAYVDGALDALADAGALPAGATAADVRAHLESCADCRARLADARAVRERAGVVLRDAGAAVVDVPAFDAIVARGAGVAGTAGALGVSGAADAGGVVGAAGAGAVGSAGSAGSGGAAGSAARPSRRASWLPLAWAATVVLAVGAGWWGSMIWRSDPLRMAGDESSAVRSQSAAPVAADATQEGQLAEVGAPANAMDPAAGVAAAGTSEGADASAAAAKPGPEVGRAAAAGPQTADARGDVAAAEAVRGKVVTSDAVRGEAASVDAARDVVAADAARRRVGAAPLGSAGAPVVGAAPPVTVVPPPAAPPVTLVQPPAAASPPPAQAQAQLPRRVAADAAVAAGVELAAPLAAREPDAALVTFRMQLAAARGAGAAWTAVDALTADTLEAVYVIDGAGAAAIAVGAPALGMSRLVRVRQTLRTGEAVELLSAQPARLALPGFDAGVALRSGGRDAERSVARGAEAVSRQAAALRSAPAPVLAPVTRELDVIGSEQLADGRSEVLVRLADTGAFVVIRGPLPPGELVELARRLVRP